MSTGSNKSLPPSPLRQSEKSEIEKLLQSGLADFSLRELLGALLSSLAHAERGGYLQNTPGDKANGFYPRVPQFPNAPSALRSEEMFLVVRNGVRYSGMGAWKDLMSEDETWKVVMFLSNIHSLPPAVKSEWEGGSENK